MKAKYLNVSLYFLIPFLISLLFILLLIDSARIIEVVFSITINDHSRFNSFVIRNALVITTLIIFLNFLNPLKGTHFYQKLKNGLGIILSKISSLLNLKALLLISIAYLIVLFLIGIGNYDLGVDEATYLIYATTFYKYGFAFCTINHIPFFVDNYAMLPFYLCSTILFILNTTEVWHFKLLGTVLSFISLTLIIYVLRRIYDSRLSILFLFFIIIQPGFGFVATSAFGEIMQAGFFFLAVYLWLHNTEEIDLKTLILTSLLFAFTVQTKLQVLQPFVLTMILFHFVDRRKKSLKVLVLSLLFVFLLAVIRFIPAMFYDSSLLMKSVKFWYLGEFMNRSNIDSLLLIYKIQLFNKFFPLIVTALVFIILYPQIKTSFERFIYTFAIISVLWWIFLFPFSTYRHFFMIVIPIVYLLSLCVLNLYSKYEEDIKAKKFLFKLVTSLAFVILMAWGFSSNLIYATIGYNDGVQFDLSGTKSRMVSPVSHDNSQKEFYKEMKATLQQSDTVFIASSGQSIFVTQFYLDNYRVFDLNMLINSVKKSNTPKFVIIDQISFPLGLERGYLILDSLGLNKKQLIKKGDYELYSVNKK